MSNRYQKSALNALLISILLMACTAVAWAQDSKDAKPATEAQGTVATVWKIWQKAGQEAQFEAAIKKYGAWRKSAGEKFVWHIYQPVVGSDLGYFIIRSGPHAWKDMDSNEAWELQAKASDAFNTTVGPYTERAEHYFSELDTKNSNWIESPDYKYFAVTNYSLKSGTYAERSEAMAKITKAVKDEKWPYPYSISDTIGGSGGMSIVTPMKSYADMADPDPSLMKILAKSLGSESAAADTFRKFGSTIKSTDHTIFLYRPDLSTPE